MTKPAPLTPADSDLSDFGFMPLEVGRFRRSDLVTQEEPEAIVAAILLWGSAWHSKPAASLSNDDRSLAQAAGFGRGVDAFLAIKSGALKGFIECSDGRLYHPVVAEKAREAWEAKLKRLWRTECARIRKHNERNADDQNETMTFDEFRTARYPQTASHATDYDVTRDNDELSDVTGDISHARHAEDAENVTRDNEAPSTPKQPVLIASVEQSAANLSNGSMSHATGIEKQRDESVDSCARAEKGEGQGQGDSIAKDILSLPLTDDEIPNEGKKPFDLHNGVWELAKLSGLNATDPGKLSNAILQLKAWLDEGMDFEATIKPTIESRTMQNPSEPVYSLKYFDAAVRKAHAVQAKLPPSAPPKQLEPIAAKDADDERVVKFRRRLKYHMGEAVYGKRYAPEHVAIDVVDERFVRILFRDDFALKVSTIGFDEDNLRMAANSIGLDVMTRTLSELSG